jgi:hypothetical protein
MTWINHATPSGFGGLVCLFAATFILPLRGYSLLGMPATSAPLGGLQALNVFLIAQHVKMNKPKDLLAGQPLLNAHALYGYLRVWCTTYYAG